MGERQVCVCVGGGNLERTKYSLKKVFMHDGYSCCKQDMPAFLVESKDRRFIHRHRHLFSTFFKVCQNMHFLFFESLERRLWHPLTRRFNIEKIYDVTSGSKHSENNRRLSLFTQTERLQLPSSSTWSGLYGYNQMSLNALLLWIFSVT